MKISSLLVLVIPASLFLTSCDKECECPQEVEKTLTLQPGPADGQDCLVSFRETDGGFAASSNHNISNVDLVASRWTYNAEGDGQGTIRAYFKFSGLSAIPQTAVVKSAKLTLYGLPSSATSPEGNSWYPGTPYSSYSDNKCWLKRIIGNWDESTVTWNNKPGTTDVNQVEVAASTSKWNYNVTDLDVTQLVKDMVSFNENYGFDLQLQNEQIYRALVFASSEDTDPTKRPKLVVVYETKE